MNDYLIIKYDFELIFNIKKSNKYFSNHIFKKSSINISQSNLYILDSLDDIKEYIRSTVEIEYNNYINKIKHMYLNNQFKGIIININNIRV